jgi:hypothetical protein
MPIYIQVNAKQPQGYCDLARRLFPGLNTGECVERNDVSDKEPPLGERVVRALCSKPSIELAAKIASRVVTHPVARSNPALEPILESAFEIGLGGFCDYALHYLALQPVSARRAKLGRAPSL